MVFGQDKRLPYLLILQKAEPIHNLDDYVTLRLADFQNIYERVKENIKRKDGYSSMVHRALKKK